MSTAVCRYSDVHEWNCTFEYLNQQHCTDWCIDADSDGHILDGYGPIRPSDNYIDLINQNGSWSNYTRAQLSGMVKLHIKESRWVQIRSKRCEIKEDTKQYLSSPFRSTQETVQVQPTVRLKKDNRSASFNPAEPGPARWDTKPRRSPGPGAQSAADCWSHWPTCRAHSP